MTDQTIATIDVLEWVRIQIISLCEATEGDPMLAIVTSNQDDKQGAFARGRISEAKGIRRAMAEVIRVRIEELREQSHARDRTFQQRSKTHGATIDAQAGTPGRQELSNRGRAPSV